MAVIEKDIELAAVEAAINNSIGWAKNKDLKLLYSTFADNENFLEVHPEDTVIKGIIEFRNMEKFWTDDKFKAIGYKIRDLQIQLSGSGDVAWFFCRLDDENEWDGKPLNWMDVRWTGVLEKRNGSWRMVQQHFSYPEK